MLRACCWSTEIAPRGCWSVYPNATFSLQWSELDRPLGGGVPANPLLCTFAPRAIVEDDARSVAQFYALLAAGRLLEVEVYGISDGAGGADVYLVEVDLD